MSRNYVYKWTERIAMAVAITTVVAAVACIEPADDTGIIVTASDATLASEATAVNPDHTSSQGATAVAPVSEPDRELTLLDALGISRPTATAVPGTSLQPSPTSSSGASLGDVFGAIMGAYQHSSRNTRGFEGTATMEPGAPGGEGSLLTVSPWALQDGMLEPGEAFDQSFWVGLASLENFGFRVTMYGTPEGADPDAISEDSEAIDICDGACVP